MKILISGSFWHGSLEESYAQAFESLGWTVLRFDWDEFARAHPLAKVAFGDRLLRLRIADRVGNWLISEIESRQPDIVLVIKGRFIHPNVIHRAKEILGTRPIVNFNPDSPWEKLNSSQRLLAAIPMYNFHFTWNSHLKDRFAAAGAKSIEFLPFAYDPALHRPIEDSETRPQFDAVFLGTFSPDRDKLLSHLVGCNIAIWGNGWEKSMHVPKQWLQGKAIYGAEATRMQSLAPIALNILRAQNEGSHNMRTFEIPATRHAMLTTRSAEQSQWFAEGSEMECYASPEELLQKILLLSRDSERARRIAEAGHRRVREETYAKRARTILDALGFAK
ncbi:MAG: glycosyltransferase [Bacteroidota bacterium]|nr:glycosyltransferase [Bacteroidota bacterium]MDP4232707.1 glycosyltransferase [Bacteroidota bacterium]MDP4243160.1 glycosyltransferase [Bacteroidota bacterium]MDP4287617.1 glycosyltransferase [Bacteroidota bacterium]